MTELELGGAREELLRLGLTGGLEELLGAAGRALGTSLLLGDALLDVLAWTGEPQRKGGTWEDFIAAGYAPSFDDGGEALGAPHPLPHGFYACRFPNRVRGGTDLLIDLEAGGEDLGHLVVVGVGAAHDPGRDSLLAALCLALAAQLRQGRRGEGRLAAEGLLLRLLRGEEGDEALLPFRAKLAGLESQGVFSLLLADLRGYHPQGKSVSALRSELEGASGGVAVVEGEILTLLLGRALGPGGHRQLGDSLARAGLRGVITGAFDRLAQLPQRYRRGRQALELLPQIEDRSPLVEAGRLEVYRLVKLALREGGMEEEPALHTLAQADQNGRSAYLDTLRAYLSHAQKPVPTCAALHIHRNTLDYRLRRMEELAGLSWEDGDLMARLYLGLCRERLEGLPLGE